MQADDEMLFDQTGQCKHTILFFPFEVTNWSIGGNAYHTARSTPVLLPFSIPSALPRKENGIYSGICTCFVPESRVLVQGCSSLCSLQAEILQSSKFAARNKDVLQQYRPNMRYWEWYMHCQHASSGYQIKRNGEFKKRKRKKKRCLK